MSYNPLCLRKVANWSYVSAKHKFDKKTFDVEQMKEDIPKNSSKMNELLKNIKELDAADLKKHGKQFKHFIFSDVKQNGAKLIAGALIADGYNLAYDKNLKLKSDNELLKTKGDNFFLLCSTAIYNKTINVKTKKAILDKFNQRPENPNGDLVRIIILDVGFKEGVDIFDIKYVHIFEPQTSKADMKQAVGRATRLCGQKGLEFDPKQGWPLTVFLYDVTIPDTIGETKRKIGEATALRHRLKKEVSR